MLAVSPVSLATDLTLILPDRIGSLAETTRLLARAGINIIGHGGFPAWAGEGILHLVVDDPARAVSALHAANIEVREERQVLVVPVDDHPGSLAAAFECIAAQGVNVDLTYALADARVVIGVDDVARARRALDSQLVGGEGFEPPTSSV